MPNGECHVGYKTQNSEEAMQIQGCIGTEAFHRTDLTDALSKGNSIKEGYGFLGSRVLYLSLSHSHQKLLSCKCLTLAFDRMVFIFKDVHHEQMCCQPYATAPSEPATRI